MSSGGVATITSCSVICLSFPPSEPLSVSGQTSYTADLTVPIHDEWQRRLRAGNFVDFEDMLLIAAEQLGSGAFDPGYELVMVDEFQDSSVARARVVQALVHRPGQYLLTVGDDWQSINRFAGADISVMVDFETWFGTGRTMRLENTFRSPQSICNAASSFVTKNPRQLRKTVVSARPDPGLPPRLIRVASGRVAAAVADQLREYAAGIASGVILPGAAGRVSVNVLGRYRFDRDEVMPSQLPPGLEVTFRTVHGSKGLEADYIIIPRLSAGRYGFPSGIVDDPLLDLVMADPDDYPHAEERRLL